MGHLRLLHLHLHLLSIHLYIYLYVYIYIYIPNLPMATVTKERKMSNVLGVSICISLCTSSAANTSMLSEMERPRLLMRQSPPVTLDIHLCGQHPDVPGLQEARALPFIETALLLPIPGTGLWFASSFQLQSTSRALIAAALVATFLKAITFIYSDASLVPGICWPIFVCTYLHSIFSSRSLCQH